MLVQTPSPTASPSLPPSRRNRKRKARGESHGSRERAKTPRRQPPPVRPIAKPEPDEDSGLGFDESSQGGCESARLLTTSHPSLVTNVRVTPQEEDASDGFISDRQTKTQQTAQPPFLKGIRPVSRCGRYRLELVREPESRHRARYQTEGSRGAVKDSTGKSSPQVVLRGYTRPCQLQMYVGSDADGCSPHLFYQACRVTGKTASASRELTLDGTVVIETEMLPEPCGAAASARCDCLGILKQRNVDIETRVAAAGGGGSGASGRRAVPLRKGPRTTSCRLVFRVTIVNDLGETETLQIASRSVVCTQPQGVPEVTKLSLKEAPCTGGAELILLGKNFVKDSCVVFAETEEEGGGATWSEVVSPQKEHHQSVHLVCRVPAYWDQALAVPRAVSVMVRSGDKESDPAPFTFLPAACSRGMPCAAVTCPSEHRNAPTAPAAATAAAAAGRLINGVSQAAIAINRHFAETGEIRLEAAKAGQPQRRTPEPAPAPAAANGATQAGEVSILNEEASGAASHAVFMAPTPQKTSVFADSGSTQVQEAQPMVTGERNSLQHPAVQNLEQTQQMEEEDLKPSRRVSVESLHITQHLAVRDLQQADQILAVDSRSAVLQLSQTQNSTTEEVSSTEALLNPGVLGQPQQPVQDVGGHAAASASSLVEYQQQQQPSTPLPVADQPTALHADSGACWTSADAAPKWSQAGVSATPQTQSWAAPAPSADDQCNWTGQSEPPTVVKKDWTSALVTEPAPASQPWAETVESAQTATESQPPAQNQLPWSQPKPTTTMEWAPTAEGRAETPAWTGRSGADASAVQVWSVESAAVVSHAQVVALTTEATPASGETPAPDLRPEPVPAPAPHGWTAADPLPSTSAGWSLSTEPGSLAASVWPATSMATTLAPSAVSEVKPAAVWVAVPAVPGEGAAVPLATDWSPQVTSEPAAGNPPAWTPAAQEQAPAAHTWSDQQVVATSSQAGPPAENAPTWPQQQQQQPAPVETTAAGAPVPGAEQWQHQLKPVEAETWAGAEVHSWSAEQLADVLGDPMPGPERPAEQQQQQLVGWTAATVAQQPPPVEPQQEPAGWVVVPAQHPQQQLQDTHLAEGGWAVVEPQRQQPQQQRQQNRPEGGWAVAEPQRQQPQQQQDAHLPEGGWAVAEPQQQQPQQQQQQEHLPEAGWTVAGPQQQQPQQQQDSHLPEGSWTVANQKQEVAQAGDQRQLVQSRWQVALPEPERQQQPQQGWSVPERQQQQPQSWSGGEPAADAASPGDPMWGEAAFGSDTAPAVDPLADMPTGMGLIEYINGDHE